MTRTRKAIVSLAIGASLTAPMAMAVGTIAASAGTHVVAMKEAPNTLYRGTLYRG